MLCNFSSKLVPWFLFLHLLPTPATPLHVLPQVKSHLFPSMVTHAELSKARQWPLLPMSMPMPIKGREWRKQVWWEVITWNLWLLLQLLLSALERTVPNPQSVPLPGGGTPLSCPDSVWTTCVHMILEDAYGREQQGNVNVLLHREGLPYAQSPKAHMSQMPSFKKLYICKLGLVDTISSARSEM